MSCPHCKESARFVGYRPKRIVSLVGDLKVERGYYHCGSCGQGHFPWDDVLRLSPQRLTPAAEEVTTLAGIQESFGKAAERTLRKLAGITLSESTVERTTETAGEQLGQALEAGAVFGPKQTWDWHKDKRGKTCAYVSLDATGILMQGPNGAKVEGKMVTVGMIFNPQTMRWGALFGWTVHLGGVGSANASAGRSRGHGSRRSMDRLERRRQRPG
jgi:hypothetical protein